MYRQGKYKEALQVYLEIEKQIPESARQLKKNLAEEFYTLSREFIWPNRKNIAVYSRDGEKAIEKAIALNGKEARYYYYLGAIHAKVGRYFQAIAACKRAIELDPKFASPYDGLGNVYFEQGNYTEAIAAYQKAIELDPKSVLVYNNLAWTYLLKGDLTQAKDKFEEAINLDPKNYSLVFNLGLVYALQGNVDEARSQWQKGLAICQGSDAWDRAIHALYTVAIGETERGMTEMQKVLDEEGSAVGALRNALGDAEVLARCPVKPEGIDTVIDMLKQAIG